MTRRGRYDVSRRPSVQHNGSGFGGGEILRTWKLWWLVVWQLSPLQPQRPVQQLGLLDGHQLALLARRQLLAQGRVHEAQADRVTSVEFEGVIKS